MTELRLLGGASIETADGRNAGPIAQRHRIALLAVLAVGRSRPIRREKIIGLLWPERDTEHARKLLNQSVYVLRQALGEDSILSVADSLRFNSTRIRCDLVEFEQAVEAGELERAVSIYDGAFMDGFFLDDAEEFERWLESERTRLAELRARVLEALADAAEGRGDWQTAARWWKALVTLDPCDTRVVLRLMQVFESAGDRAAALLAANAHRRVLREELDAGPPSAFETAVTRLRSEPQADRPAPPPQGTNPAESDRTSAQAPAVSVMMEEAADQALYPIRYRTNYGAWILVLVGTLVAANWLPSVMRSGGTESAEEVMDPGSTAQLGVTDRLMGAERPAAERTASVAAYELYRRGTDPAALRDDVDARRARDLLVQAVTLDPNYGAAWAALARLSLRVGAPGASSVNADETFQVAIDAARRAIEIDETLAEGHAVVGLVSMLQFDFPAAEAALNRAMVLDPQGSSVREWRATLYLWTARPADALSEAEMAAAISPLSPGAQAEVARALSAADRCNEALARLERLVAVEPPLLRVPMIAAQCKARLDQWEGAIAELHGTDPLDQALLGHLLARHGLRAEALAIRDRFLELRREGRVGAFPLFAVEAGLGNLDQAFEWLGLAFEDRSLLASNNHFTVLQPVLDVLASDARLQRFEPLARLVDVRVQSRSSTKTD